MFKIWVDTFTSEMKDIKKDVRETNELLRDEVSTTKAILTQHIKEYSEDRTEGKEKFDKIFKVLRSREGVYRAAKLIKWGGAILFAGLLTAAGASIWSHYTITTTEKVDNTE